MNCFLCSLLRLLVSAWLSLAAVSVGIYMGGHWSEGAGRTGCRKFGRFILRRAYVAVDQVLLDAVHNDLHGLRFIFSVDPDRLVQVHPFLAHLVVVHNHFEVVVLVLGVGLAQRESDGADALELLGPHQVKLSVTALSALL